MSRAASTDWPSVEVASAKELRDWLSRQSPQASSHWLIHGKKSAGEAYLPYGEMVKALLAYGWIDSLPRSVDETRTSHLISPRKPGSVWSKDNRERVAELEREGRMAPAGREAVERARQDGSWDALKGTEEGIAPPDLADALQQAAATLDWERFSLSVRRRALEFLLSAKRDETRQRRITRIVDATRVGVDPTQWRPKG